MGAFDSEQQTETQEQQQQRIQAAVDATADRGMLPSRNGLYHFEIDHSGDAANTPAATTLASKVVDSVTESNVWKNLFQTDEQRLLEAQKFNDKYGIPTEVIVQGGNDAINKMREVDNTYETNKKLFGEYGKEFSLKNLYEYYPEMQSITEKDPNAAAIALKNIENVKATKGIFDAMVTGYNRMQDMMKRNDIGARMAQGEDSPELRSELDRLENNLREYRTTNGSEHPLEKVLGDTAAQGGMIAAQWWGGALKRAPQGMIMGSMAGAAVAGGATLGVGAPAGAVAGGITGFWAGANVGMFEEMYRSSIGGKYLENIRRTDKNGNRIMSDNEARGQAAAYALVDTSIEFLATKIMAKTVGATMPNAALKEIFHAASERAAMSRGLMANVKRNATKAATISGTELAEEGLQDVNERLQDNFLAKYHPEIRRNTLGDVVEGAVNAMVEAVPSVVGLGALGAAGGNVRMVRDVINSGNGLRKVAIQQEVNAAGAQLLESLRQDQSSNQLMRKAPEVYAQVVQNQAERIGMGMMYVDAEIAMQSEEGTAALNKMVEKGVVSEKDLNEAITNGSTLEVPVGQYMQKVAPEVETSAIQEATAWTDGGINMGRLKFMQDHYKQIQARIEKEQTDRQAKAVNELMTEHFQDEATQNAALDVVSRNPFDLKRSHSQAVKEAREAYHLAVGMEGFKEGMGQGVSIVKNDEGNGVRASNNAPWYSDFYKQNKRAPNAYELDRLAFDEFSKQVGTDTSPEAQAAIADVKSKLDHLDQLEAIKDQVKELAESDYMLRKTLSKEALSVYKDTQLTLLKGNKMVSEQAKAAAFLFAKHADVMAAYMQEAGSKDFTAADYAKQHGIQIGGELPAGALKQEIPEIVAAREEQRNYLKEHGQTIYIDTPEREDLRAKIADKLYGTGAKIKNRQAYFVLGLPASGKSSVSEPLAKKTGSLIIDSDMAKEKLPEFNNGKFAGAVHEESDLIWNYVLDKATDNDDNIVLPLVGKNIDKIRAVANNLRALGYDTHLIYVHLPAEKAVSRAIQRFKETGRFVDPEYISNVGYKPLDNYDILKGEGGWSSYEGYTNDVKRGETPELLERNVAGRRHDVRPGNQNATGKDKQKTRSLKEKIGLNRSGNDQGDFYLQKNDTDAFNRWFGDSKVVDEQGKPLVVYHTGTMGDSYDITKSRSYNGTPDYELPGIYLTADKDESGDYGTPDQVKALYASIQNPYNGNLTALHKELGTWRKVMDSLKEQGYDGVVNDDDLGEIIAFFPEQIKSVNNSGAFDPSNPNIYQQQDKPGARGSMTVYDSGRQLMQLFQTANYSTFVHESGHMFLEDLRMLAGMEEAPAEIRKAWQTAQEWTGWKDGADNTAAHEKWATGFEAYIREGKAPSQELKSVFRQFKDWLLQVYQDLRQLGQVPPKEVQQIFDMMLATNAEIESYVAEQEVAAFDRKGFMGELSGSDEEIVKRWREDTMAEIKERVTAEFMKSYTAEAQKEKEEFLARRRVELEKQLADSNEIYSVEALYKHFGDVVLKQRGMSIEQLQGELRRLGGTTEERLDEMMKQEERAVDSSIVSGENLRAWANEYLLSSEGQSKVIALEQTAMQRKANQVTAEVMKAMRILNENGDAKEIAKAMNELFGTKAGKEERLKSKLFGKSEKINELREKLNTLAENSSATIEEKDALISELKTEVNKTMAGLRAVRDVVVGKREVLIEQAKLQLGSSKVAMATSFQHWQNKAIQVGREADRLIVKGEFPQAMQLKNEQMLFSCLAKVAHDNNQLVAKTIDTLKDKDRRISRTERPIMLGSSERYFYQHMLYQLGLRNEDGLVPDSGFDMRYIKGALNPDVAMGIVEEDSGIISNWIQNLFEAEGRETNQWKKLTLEQFNELTMIMRAVYKVGRREYEGSTIIDANGHSLGFHDASNLLAEALAKRFKGQGEPNLLQREHDKTTLGSAKDSVEGYMLELTKIETILNRFDGGSDGIWHRFIYRPISRGAAKEREMKMDATKALAKIKSRYSKRELQKIRNEKKYIVGDTTGFTKEEIIAMALNYGTDINKRRVLTGFNVSATDMEKIFGEVMTDKDWDFVEDVWQFIGSYWEDRNRVQENLYGVPLGKEEPAKFTINGRTMTGGYYPIVYDPKLSIKADEHTVDDIVKQNLSSNAVFGLGMGSTKKRLEKVDRQIYLSFDLIPRAATEAIHHVAMREAAVDVYKLLGNKSVEMVVTQHFGLETYKLLKQWARDNWQTEVGKMDKWSKYVDVLKRNTTFAVMAFRTSTSLLNNCNVFPMAKEIGNVNAAMAILDFYNATNGSYVDKRNFVLGKSSFLRDRVNNLDKDMAQGMKIGEKGGRLQNRLGDAKDMANRYGYFFITETDLMLSMPLWKHVYDKQVRSQLGSEKSPAQIEDEAIAKADQAVRRVFGSGEVQDQVAIQKKKGPVTLFTPFYSYCSTVLNALIEGGYKVKDEGRIYPLLNAVLFWIFLPTIVETLIRTGADKDDDDEKTLARKYGINLTRNLVGGLPVIRDVFDFAITGIMGGKTYSKGNEVMALSITEKAADTVQAFLSDKKDWTDVGRSASQVTNRLVGFSDTLTDGVWTLMKFAFTDTDAAVEDLMKAIIFDQKLKSKK